MKIKKEYALLKHALSNKYHLQSYTHRTLKYMSDIINFILTLIIIINIVRIYRFISSQKQIKNSVYQFSTVSQDASLKLIHLPKKFLIENLSYYNANTHTPHRGYYYISSNSCINHNSHNEQPKQNGNVHLPNRFNYFR